ncbi:hypothetical protein FZC83_02180 [Rossellomorea marisflavi]|uniref:Uncharacterized protein n=1 Tax=Rossellomorea marisflavi TaxID=189381 RepID=A0A5D4S2S1_9BACI|nr:hypothetical protein [Rossellomorea marisflavi]TYS56404.1 hypothetical protein FZC83_02180 [Rossellomorea marisflavi]
MKLQLHLTPWYEENEFNLEKVECIKNHLAKPEGGLWTSTFNPDTGSEWIQSPFVDLFDNSKGTLIEVIGSPNILQIDSVEKAQNISDKYFFKSVLTTPCYDYEKMSEEFDAIRVSGEGLNKSSAFREYFVESTLWFNTKYLEVYGSINVLKYRLEELN